MEVLWLSSGQVSSYYLLMLLLLLIYKLSVSLTLLDEFKGLLSVCFPQYLGEDKDSGKAP